MDWSIRGARIISEALPLPWVGVFRPAWPSPGLSAGRVDFPGFFETKSSPRRRLPGRTEATRPRPVAEETGGEAAAPGSAALR